MNVASAGSRNGWQVDEKSAALGVEVVLHKASYVFPWSQFLFAEGDADEVRLIFATHDVLVTGNGLEGLLRDVAAHRLGALMEPVNADGFARSGGQCIRGLAVRKANGGAEGEEWSRG